LENDNEISIVGFGILHILTRRARELKMPNSEKVILMCDTKVIKFRVSNKLKKRVNLI